MIDIRELDGLMMELLLLNVDLKTVKFTERGIEIINEISDFAERNRNFKEHKEKGEMFERSTTRQVFGYMLNCILSAPTSIHRDISILLIMPFVRQKLRKEDEK